MSGHLVGLERFERLEVPAGPWRFRALAAGPPDGRMVLLLHGFPQSAYQWRHQLDALAGAGYRAVAFDQRGYSPEARPDNVELYGMSHLVADVVAVADELGAHEVDLVGHDWGAAVAWAVAARYPGRLRSLTAVSVPHPGAFASAIAAGSGEQARRSAYITFFREEGAAERRLSAGGGEGMRQMFTATGFPGDAAALDSYVAAMGEPGALTAALNWYRAVSIADMAGLGRIATPTLYVWSDADVAIGREAAEGTAAWIDGPYRFEILAGVSHWIPEAAPEDLNLLLLEHLGATA